MDKIFETLMAKEKETIAEHTENTNNQADILISLNYVPKRLIDDLRTACENHDKGKANAEFQNRIGKKITENKKIYFDEEKEVPHNVLSMFFIDKNCCIDYESVCFAVLYHHYRNKANYKNYIKANYALIKSSLNTCNIDVPPIIKTIKQMDNIRKLRNLPYTDKRKTYATLLKGFLHKCDYSASAGIECEYPNNFLIDSINKWKADNNVTLNELQNFCLKNTDNDIIVTAPTGMGKTEAGLLWCGDNKCFFVLPLKTAINAMYQRIQSLSGDNYKNRVALLHSDMQSYYLNDTAKNASDEFDFDYCTRSKQMSLPVTVCTPDQIFDFVLKYAGYEYKLATASYSKFIIDEIQMYSPDLLASIIHAIKMIHNMGGKFAILTATLPPFVQNELTKVFGSDVMQNDFSEFGNVRHNVSVFEEKLNSDFIFEKVNNLKNNKVKKFLVVCNSIDTADKLYNELQSKCDDNIKVNLFHARFTKKDRAKKEQQILNASKDNTTTEIWISTSVIEASLDIDFDILFTELSDLFSLFQRFGRVNRKGNKSYDTSNCFVFTELQGNAQKYHFTDSTVYNLSKKAVMTVDGVVTEQEKSALIKQYLSVENLKDSGYVKSYKSASEYLDNLFEYEKNTSEKLRSIDTVDVIPQSIYNDNKEQIEYAIKIITDGTANVNERFKMNDFIKSLTVSVSRFHNNKIINRIKLKYGEILVLGHCHYNFDTGLEYDKMVREKMDLENNWGLI